LKNLLKNTVVAIVVGVALGLILGLIIGWWAWPVTWKDTTPELLAPTVQEDYLRMAIDAYRVNKTANPQAAADLAEDRWEFLGEAAAPTFSRVQANPSYLDPASIQDYRVLIESRKGPIAVTPVGESHCTSNTCLFMQQWQSYL
jgi:hypothetical protein